MYRATSKDLDGCSRDTSHVLTRTGLSCEATALLRRPTLASPDIAKTLALEEEGRKEEGGREKEEGRRRKKEEKGRKRKRKKKGKEVSDKGRKEKKNSHSHTYHTPLQVCCTLR